jgi:ubiquinone/menaquinone biosynthesis C-methylase UbiE
MKQSNSNTSFLSAYVSPDGKNALEISAHGLCENNQRIFPFLAGPSGTLNIPNFLNPATLSEAGKVSLSMYDTAEATDFYSSFMSWLFRTFDVNERDFRNAMVSKLRLTVNSRVLITGCGLGDDVFSVLDALQGTGEVFASDLAPQMALATHRKLTDIRPDDLRRVSLSVCDACYLPFPDGFFDAAFHFGGVNLFDDLRGGITEMARVTKDGGCVVFGDEGIAPWLLDSEYARMAIANNPLWSAPTPIAKLPFSATEVNVSWVLGNCFYLIDFVQRTGGPHMNPDIPHAGRRGGSMRTRFSGQLEGVSSETKERVLREAATQGKSVYDWLEAALENQLRKPRS